MSHNYFSITTPQGTGGIGIIELFGRDALKIIGKVFKPIRNKKINTVTHPYPSSRLGRDSAVAPQEGIFPEVPSNKRGFRGVFKLNPNRIYLGHIVDNPPRLPRGPAVAGPLAMTRSEIIDEVIIHFTPARNSLTKLDTVEINAHGGIMSCRLIGHLIKRFGVKELSQPEVITLAHKRGRLDKIQAEALEYLLQAQTPLAAAVLLDQYNGALSKALKSKKNLNALRESARFGIALTHPKRILILGKPNVGKSTLFNALLGQDRAITHHLPGTTRDTIEDVLAIEEFPFVLVDTAGLRKSTNDAIEKIGMAYARKEIPKADVILLVVEKDEIASLNNSSPQRHQDTKKNLSSCLSDLVAKFNLFNKLQDKIRAPIIMVVNKVDTIIKIRDAGFGIRDKFISISALKRTGIDELRKKILKACKLDKFRYKPGRAVIFTEKQMALIH